MIHEFKTPIDVVTPMGDGYLFYVQAESGWQNDMFAVIMRNGGNIYHFRSDQIKFYANGTWDINKDIAITEKKP